MARIKDIVEQERKLPSLALETDGEHLRSRYASFRGVLSHYKTGWLAMKPAFSLLFSF